MTIRVALHHETEYVYEKSVAVGPQLVRLRPAYHCRTQIDAYSLRVAPETHFCNWQQDPYGNPIARFVFPKHCDRLKVTVDLVADMTVINPFDFFVEDESDCWPFEYSDALLRQLEPYLNCDDDSEVLDDWVVSLPKQADRIVDFLVAVNQRFHNRVDYTLRMEPGVQTPEQTLQLSSGSCRDSAWLMVQSLRKIGMAARFVSGYLIQLVADEVPVEGPAGPTEDFCDLHAWVEVYLPGAGWVGLDPTSGLFAGEGHIPLACTPSYADAAPITGGHEPCEVEFHHTMSVSRYYEESRVTKPYTDKQWDDIMRVGRQVDEKLDANDVRLTMGGEPTFVSIDNPEDPQWSTEAVGEEKRVISNQLLLKMRDEFAPGGLLHYGQGKWYPGESLPRWALSCLWRRDGEPIWKDPQWIADEGAPSNFTSEDAKRFIGHLSRELNISAKMTFPVYEDTFHYLWAEDRLPVDVDPADPKLSDPNERAMMMRTFRQGLGAPVGHVLPLRRAWWQSKPGWIGGKWPVRSDKVYLIPGDSPIGLRLPLETLPTSSSAESVFYTLPVDPTVDHVPLPRRDENGIQREPMRDSRDVTGGAAGPVQNRAVNAQVLDEEDDDDLPTSDDVVRTALCVECRHGRIHLFLPPTQRVEDYLDLIESIESTCAALKIPVLVDGYLPPPDDRLDIFKVTPDPGVIEVNTQPSSSWDELVGLTESLYNHAKACRLGTNKFDLDGRHTGTGGGNHVVLGGRRPTDSPFLRRPDLLGSLLTFWNNHPSLSYLFSSRFIGPTSQAPRFDESRRDAVYEMEIALEQLPPAGQRIQPWLVDRLFRDLLVDLTGNTHRAEICIDKLYSPDSVTGRLGLVELRGFEMPPHARMSLAQQLLVRGLISAFWEKPYRRPLADWGTALHDKFMLPHFIWQDLDDVCRELSASGIDLDTQWFFPHFEFRFPPIGDVTYDDVTLQLRSAIEPWYVMGEEPGGGGTARYVDSSLERLEVRLKNLNPRRHALMCNGIRVPLHDTGVHGEFVAGIRYRAWQPPRCLHPTIGVHAPVRMELIDLNSSRSVGGCTYHVAHPGGRGTDRFPVNANEAESRRAARFETIGMSGGTVQVPAITPGRGPMPFPVTLDLRRCEAATTS